MSDSIQAHYYQHFDADFAREIPAESYGGWKSATIPVDWNRTALVVMHAWDCGTRAEFPGWHRAVEYMPRAEAIGREVFPPLLQAARAAKLHLFHVISQEENFRRLPNYRTTLELAGSELPAPASIEAGEVVSQWRAWRSDHVFPGAHNRDDIARGFARLDFPAAARPLDDEPIAATSHQLFVLCRHYGIDHLVYAGFAIDGCLLMSPGGMIDMSRHGLVCSALRDAVTAIENRETARTQSAKELALWRVALQFGWVFDTPDFISALAVRS